MIVNRGKININIRVCGFDRVLLSMDGSIGGLFLFVKGSFALKSKGWRCDWEREVEQPG